MARTELRIHRGHVHGNIIRKFLELRVLGNKVCFARKHDSSYDGSACMSVCGGNTRAERPVSFFGSDRGALLTEDYFCLLDIPTRFLKCLLALHDRYSRIVS